MQLIMLALMMAALLAALPLASNRVTPAAVVAYDELSASYSAQYQIFATAAWATNATTPGTIDRAAMTLPASYTDINAAYPNQAYSDGTYIWIFSGNPASASQRIDVFADNPQVAVGIAGNGTITWRDGTSAALPSLIPANCLVIRAPVA